jgi:DNA-binding MarR family transcriptional regulator
VADEGDMVFDTLIANAGRLRILTALAVENRQEFVRLRRLTHLTDGNLSAHAKRLQGAGMIEVEKSFRDGKPVTTFHLTEDGRRRLTAHVDQLLAAVRVAPETETVAASADEEEDGWVD